MRSPLLLTATAALVVLALAGCTQPTPAPPTTVAPTPSSSDAAGTTILNPALVPKPLIVATAENTAVEGTRLGDELQQIIDAKVIVNVSDASQLVPATGDTAAYYAVYRSYTLDPAIDPLTLAGVIVSGLVQSGWLVHDSNNKDGVYIAALSGGTQQEPWFVLVGGDASVAGQSVVTVQIASPDIPG